MDKLLKQVTLDRCNRKKDKSVSMTFITQLEQTPEELMAIDRLLGDSGVLYFKSNGDLNAQEIKELDRVEIENEGKSKSQRLRDVLFVHFEQNGNSYDTFRNFYSTEMERIIEHYKSKLAT